MLYIQYTYISKLHYFILYIRSNDYYYILYRYYIYIIDINIYILFKLYCILYATSISIMTKPQKHFT